MFMSKGLTRVWVQAFLGCVLICACADAAASERTDTYTLLTQWRQDPRNIEAGLRAFARGVMLTEQVSALSELPAIDKVGDDRFEGYSARSIHALLALLLLPDHKDLSASDSALIDLYLQEIESLESNSDLEAAAAYTKLRLERGASREKFADTFRSLPEPKQSAVMTHIGLVNQIYRALLAERGGINEAGDEWASLVEAAYADVELRQLAWERSVSGRFLLNQGSVIRLLNAQVAWAPMSFVANSRTVAALDLHDRHFSRHGPLYLRLFDQLVKLPCWPEVQVRYAACCILYRPDFPELQFEGDVFAKFLEGQAPFNDHELVDKVFAQSALLDWNRKNLRRSHELFVSGPDLSIQGLSRFNVPGINRVRLTIIDHAFAMELSAADGEAVVEWRKQWPDRWEYMGVYYGKRLLPIIRSRTLNPIDKDKVDWLDKMRKVARSFAFSGDLKSSAAIMAEAGNIAEQQGRNRLAEYFRFESRNPLPPPNISEPITSDRIRARHQFMRDLLATGSDESVLYIVSHLFSDDRLGAGSWFMYTDVHEDWRIPISAVANYLKNDKLTSYFCDFLLLIVHDNDMDELIRALEKFQVSVTDWRLRGLSQRGQKAMSAFIDVADLSWASANALHVAFRNDARLACRLARRIASDPGVHSLAFRASCLFLAVHFPETQPVDEWREWVWANGDAGYANLSVLTWYLWNALDGDSRKKLFWRLVKEGESADLRAAAFRMLAFDVGQEAEVKAYVMDRVADLLDESGGTPDQMDVLIIAYAMSHKLRDFAVLSTRINSYDGSRPWERDQSAFSLKFLDTVGRYRASGEASDFSALIGMLKYDFNGVVCELLGLMGDRDFIFKISEYEITPKGVKASLRRYLAVIDEQGTCVPLPHSGNIEGWHQHSRMRFWSP